MPCLSIYHFQMQNVDYIDYQYFIQMAVQIGYGNAISTECKPLKSNDLAREVHFSNIIIILDISNCSLHQNGSQIVVCNRYFDSDH